MSPAKRTLTPSKDDRDSKKSKVASTAPASPSPASSSATTISSSPDVISPAVTTAGAFVVNGLNAVARAPEHGVRFGGVRSIDGLPSTRIVDDFKYNASVIIRLLRIATTARGVNLEPMFNPDQTNRVTRVSAYGSLSRRVILDDPTQPDVRDKHKPDASYSSVFRVSSVRNSPSDAEKALEISVSLIHRLGPRFVAMVADILSFDNPVFVLSNDGISFVTSVKGTGEDKYMKHAPMNSASHGPSPRPFDEKIPVFDGRDTFQPTRYSTLPQLDDDLVAGDYVFLGFTPQGYMDTGKDKKGSPVQKVKLLVQFAVLLARAGGTQDSDGKGKVSAALADETPLGVTDTSPMAPLLPDEYEVDNNAVVDLPDSEVY